MDRWRYTPATPPELLGKYNPPANGIIMRGSKGYITCDVYGANPKLFVNGEDPVAFDTSKQGNLDLIHNSAWTEAVKAGFNSADHKALTSSFDYAGPFTETVLMGNLAIRAHQLRKKQGRSFDYYGRKKLTWDGENMEITNLKEANQFVTKPYRDGWQLANL